MRLFATVATLLVGSAVAAPAANVIARDVAGEAVQGNGQGRHGGLFYLVWSDVTPKTNVAHPIQYRNLPGGRYAVQWDEGFGDFYAGKGWNSTDADKLKTVEYSGTYAPNGTSSLSLYGWMSGTNARINVEYYIMDNWSKYNRAESYPKKGTVETDGGVYDIFIGSRYAQGLEPSTRQIFSIRQEKRTGGKISVKNHFDAWKALGEKFGSHHYSVLAVDGYRSTGEADITVTGE